jgi:preprotein translocase subunit SecY
MKRFFETLRNIWRVEELKNRILVTLGLILVFRIGSFVVLPGVDTYALAEAAKNAKQGGLADILALFSGGAFSNASIMALGIMPYISASIIMQLLGMAVPAVQKMQKEGESGRNKINNITRWLTIAICAAQAPSYLGLYVGSSNAIIDGTPLWWIQSTLILIAGTMFAMWLGERITDRGVGNGISLLITVGILAGLPAAFLQEIISKSSNPIMIIMEIVVFMVVVLVTVLIVQGVRKVPISVAKKIVQSRGAVEAGGVRDYIPLKVNASGVMPIIFAQAVMTVPIMLMSSMADSEGGGTFMGFGDIFGFGYNAILFILILVFTYFYTAIMINPKQMAEDMKQQGSFIPGVKPGEETASYLDELISRITLPGAFFLATIAIIPAFAKLAGVTDGFSMFFGGTSLLIMVAVVLDTLQQIESYLLNRHYDGLMEGTKVRGRRTDGELSGI